MSNQVIAAARQVVRELHGVVVSAGLMQKTVKVRVGGQQWKQAVQKVRADPSIVFKATSTNKRQEADALLSLDVHKAQGLPCP